jgi:RNA-binding protein
MNKHEHKAVSVELESTLQIGKSGIEVVVEELERQLNDRKLVKVKFLKSAFIEGNRQELSEKLASLTDSELIDIRGNTAVFRRKG